MGFQRGGAPLVGVWGQSPHKKLRFIYRLERRIAADISSIICSESCSFTRRKAVLGVKPSRKASSLASSAFLAAGDNTEVVVVTPKAAQQHDVVEQTPKAAAELNSVQL